MNPTSSSPNPIRTVVRFRNSGSIAARLGLLAAMAVLLTSCASFQARFDKDFVNSRLMRLASNPDEIIPEFAWADHGCESVNLFGGGLSGGGGCPT